MKPGAILVNTARGGLVVEDDLAEALRSGHIAATGLDAFLSEPPDPKNPLLALDNVLLSPHTGANDAQANRDMTEGAVQNVIDLFHGCLSPSALITPPGPGRQA